MYVQVKIGDQNSWVHTPCTSERVKKLRATGGNWWLPPVALSFMGLGIWVLGPGSEHLGLEIWVCVFGSGYMGPGSEHLGPNIWVPIYGSGYLGLGIWV